MKQQQQQKTTQTKHTHKTNKQTNKQKSTPKILNKIKTKNDEIVYILIDQLVQHQSVIIVPLAQDQGVPHGHFLIMDKNDINLSYIIADHKVRFLWKFAIHVDRRIKANS